MSISPFFSTTSGQIQVFLKEYFCQKKDVFKSTTHTSHATISSLEDICLRSGKRIRSSLICLGAALFDEKINLDVIKIAAAYELIHTYFLIHDDIMDKADQRRGDRSVHTQYLHQSKRLYQANGEASHFGVSMAILVGDLANIFAFEVLQDTQLDRRTKKKLSSYIFQVVSETIFGQEVDIRLSLHGKVSIRTLMNVYRLKSGKYTFQAPLHLGALIAGAKQRYFFVLSAFALPSGLIFQITDDIIGLFGDERKTGKPISSDISQNKKTVLFVYAYQRATDSQKRSLDSILGKKTITKAEVATVKQIVIDTGSLTYCQRLISRYYSQAVNALKEMKTLGLQEIMISELEDLLFFIKNRVF